MVFGFTHRRNIRLKVSEILLIVLVGQPGLVNLHIFPGENESPLLINPSDCRAHQKFLLLQPYIVQRQSFSVVCVCSCLCVSQLHVVSALACNVKKRLKVDSACYIHCAVHDLCLTCRWIIE